MANIDVCILFCLVRTIKTNEWTNQYISSSKETSSMPAVGPEPIPISYVRSYHYTILIFIYQYMVDV